MFIDGHRRDAADGATLDVVNPATGRVIGHVACAATADVDAAVSAAHAAFPSWAGLPAPARERILLAAADAVSDAEKVLVDILVDESGSTITKARYEVVMSADLLRTAAGECRRVGGETMPHDNPMRRSIVVRQPLGVVAAISPFNAPLALLVKMIAFAIAAGNCVIAKPSEETPLIALELARILHDAGLPAGVFGVVCGLGPAVGETLVRHRGVDGISFTGSSATGARIAAAAAEGMKRLQLELGGKSPVVVLDDADPSTAAETIIAGAFAHAGQICMAGSRVIVEQPAYDAVVDALVTHATELHLGDLRDPRTVYGPLINAGSLAKVQAAVDASGGLIACGGQVRHGLVYEPTVVVEPNRTGVLWRDETFGPVLSVVAADDLDDAIALANDSVYGLSAGVLTNDLTRGMTIADRLRSGAVHLGTHPFHTIPTAPIGGYGLSGIGRSGGHYSVEHFTEPKWITWGVGSHR